MLLIFQINEYYYFQFGKININEKNIKCKLHKKNYNRFCLKCKLNLCELCEHNFNHYIEYSKDIYALDEDVKDFNDLMENITNNNYDELKSIIKLKRIFISSFSKNKTNYN